MQHLVVFDVHLSASVYDLTHHQRFADTQFNLAALRFQERQAKP